MNEVPVVIGGLVEKDLDLLFLAELADNPKFAGWLRRKVTKFPRGFTQLVSVRRSVHSANGETDVEVTYSDGNGRTAQLLIENKINANFQPKQLERYRKRAKWLVKHGEHKKVCVVLLAPKKYAGQKPRLADAFLTYEAVNAYLWRSRGGCRTQLTLEAISKAIEKAETGYDPVADRSVTAFWRSYWKLAFESFPGLVAGASAPQNKPSGAGFVWFSPPPHRTPQRLPQAEAGLCQPSLSQVGI